MDRTNYPCPVGNRKEILAQYTDYNEEFKNIFLEHGILDCVDLEVIDVEIFRNGREAGLEKFDDMLSNRNGYFEILLEALEETRQELVISKFQFVLNASVTPNALFLSKVFGVFRNGEFTYDKNSKLDGSGNEFVKIYKGTFQQREVAVKVIKAKHNRFYTKDDIQKEIKLFKKLDSHQNVLTLMASQENQIAKKVLIAFELCNCNLEQHILFGSSKHCTSIFPATARITDLDIIQQIVLGMRFIHSCEISHGNIQPKSILLRVLDGDSKSSSSSLLPIVQVKITGFRISKNFESEDWWAPEILKFKFTRTATDASEWNQAAIEFTKYSDVFSLGCLFYYILTAGKHPFGETTQDRVMNIRNNTPIIDENLYPLYRGNIPLIKLMLSQAKMARPNIKEIGAHFLLWGKEKTLDFLVDVSNFLCDGETPQKIKFKENIENRYREEICGTHTNGWIHPIESPHMKIYLLSNKKRNYKGKSVVELVRCIRNMKNHYENLSSEIKLTVGRLPDRFLTYWIIRFPYLVHHLWVELQALPHDDSNPLSKYYKRGAYINFE